MTEVRIIEDPLGSPPDVRPLARRLSSVTVPLGIVVLAGVLAYQQPTFVALAEAYEVEPTAAQSLALSPTVPVALCVLALATVFVVRRARSAREPWIVLGAATALAMCAYTWVSLELTGILVQIGRSF